MAIGVSSGTEVVWTWPAVPEDVPQVPHDVVSLEHGLFDSGIRFPGGTAFPGGPVLSDHSYTFDEPGNYLYYCTPHGALFEVENFQGKVVYNEFGMRGAVIVTDE